MRIMLRAAIAALSFASIGPAIASEGDGGTTRDTFFTGVPDVAAQAPVQNAPSIAAAQNEQAGQTYSHSNHSPWLFPPVGKYLDQQGRS